MKALDILAAFTTHGGLMELAPVSCAGGFFGALLSVGVDVGQSSI